LWAEECWYPRRLLPNLNTESIMRYTDTVSFEHAAIGAQSFPISMHPRWVVTPFPTSPLWQRMHARFDPEHFMYAAPPVDVGKLTLDTTSLEGLRVLRCPIKAAGSKELIVPLELQPLEPLIRYLMELELHINPKFADFWCHVSFERTQVQADGTQRVPGWHVDGFQGVRVPRHQIEHSYLWADVAPTEFCVQPFFISHLDAGRHNIFDELTCQAREANAYAGLPGHVYLIDPYVVHRSPVMQQAGWRSFFRMTFTETELEDTNNTRNLALALAQDYASRIDVRDRFYAYDGDIPWHSYGLKPVKL